MEYLGGDDTGNILGVPRGIRSDEWAVSTPMMLSQYYNASGKFPYFSDTVRGASTDMFMVYGQPVMDIAILNLFIGDICFYLPERGWHFFGMADGSLCFWFPLKCLCLLQKMINYYRSLVQAYLHLHL